MKSVIMPFAIADINPETKELPLLEFCDGNTLRSQAARRLGIDEPELEAALERLDRQGLTAPAVMPQAHDYLGQPVAEEMMLYHRLRTGLLLLNGPARRLFELCDGQTLVCEAAKEVGGLELLWQALGEFRRQRIIPWDTPLGHSPSRRAFLATFARAAAALPVITLAAAPRPVAAASACIDDQGCTQCDAMGVPSATTPPNGCVSCCDSTACFCQDLCTGGSCSCFCMTQRSCSGGLCTGADSCIDDNPDGFPVCVENGTNFICNFGGFNTCQRGCDDARAAAVMGGSGTYYCCEGPCS